MKTIVSDLKLIIIGALLVMFDFHFSSTTNGTGFKIDFLNDFIGACMIYLAVSRMSKIEIKNKAYYTHMRFVTLAAILLIGISIYDFFLLKESIYLEFFMECIGVIITVGVLLFFAAMTYFTEEKQLENSFKKMKIARNLIFWTYVLPTFIFMIPIIGSLLSSDTVFNFNYTGGLGITILILFLFVPIFYGLYAIQVTRRELRSN